MSSQDVMTPTSKRWPDLFQDNDIAGRLVAYRVAHFGGRWSGVWWSRAAGVLLRLTKWLFHFQHISALCVDDFLVLFPILMGEHMGLLAMGVLFAL